MLSNVRRPWWPELIVLVVLSAGLAWVVNEARPKPLGWLTDFSVQVVEEVRKKGLATFTPAQALEALKAGSHLFVDARDPDEFAQGHVPGAVNLPAEALLTGLGDASALPQDKPLVLYCSNLACPKSKELAQGLGEMGFTKLTLLPEGLEGWISAGGPLEGK